MRRVLSVGGRLLAGFLAGWAVWFALSRPYEQTIAACAEWLLRATERPAATRLSAQPGEIIASRSDVAPSSPRPGFPPDDLHFNFVLLIALFALDGKLWRPDRVKALGIACAILFCVHVAALVFEVRAYYATRLGEWSLTHYGALARNFWAAGFHFYLIAGRFAVPFAIWWMLRRKVELPERESERARRPRSKSNSKSKSKSKR